MYIIIYILCIYFSVYTTFINTSGLLYLNDQYSNNFCRFFYANFYRIRCHRIKIVYNFLILFLSLYIFITNANKDTISHIKYRYYFIFNCPWFDRANLLFYIMGWAQTNNLLPGIQTATR